MAEKQVQTSFSCEEALWRAAKQVAEFEGRTFGATVRRALKAYIEPRLRAKKFVRQLGVGEGKEATTEEISVS